MHDPYRRDRPGMNDPANDLIDITPHDTDTIPVGIKALRIYNPNSAAAIIHVESVAGNEVNLIVPALSLWTEPLRVRRVFETGTAAGLTIQGYTDTKVPL